MQRKTAQLLGSMIRNLSKKMEKMKGEKKGDRGGERANRRRLSGVLAELADRVACSFYKRHLASIDR